MLCVQLSVNLPVSHTVEEHLQVRVAAGSQLAAVGSIVGVQPHAGLIGIGQSVAVRIQYLTIVTVALQAWIASDLNLLVVCRVVTLIECSKLVVLAEGDIRGRVDDTQLGTTIAAKLRVQGSCSLGQHASIHLVVAGHRCASLSDNLLISSVSRLVGQAAQLVGQLFQQRLVGQRLRGRQRPVVHGTRRVISDEAIVVIGIHLFQFGVFPDIGRRCPLAAELKLIALQIPLAHLVDVAASGRHPVATATGSLFGSRTGLVVVVDHVDAVIVACIARCAFTTIDGIHATPVVDDIVEELTVHMAVVQAGTHTIEAGRTRVVVGKQAVVHRAMFASPLHAIGAITLAVARVIKTFGEDTPLNGCIVGIIEGRILLHRPREGAMVKHDTLDVLHAKG